MSKNHPRSSAKSSHKNGTKNSAEPQRITRAIPKRVELMLWGVAAGRCEFEGCNKPLTRSSVTQEQANTAQKAHIYAFSGAGPRGNAGIPEKNLNDLANLMLVCHECHVKIDQAPDGGRYSAEMLRAMKAKHERRIGIVASICPKLSSHVLLYSANVGEHDVSALVTDSGEAMFPIRYPAESSPISIGMSNSSFRDRTDEFWAIEAQQLRTLFERRVRERIASGDIKHLSVFALAPQPLLVLLGTFLGDIVPADVYQRHREPPTWTWPTSAATPAFEIREPDSLSGPPALVLSLSATITADRITSVLGAEASIWTLTVPAPHNDLAKSRDQLSQFRATVRSLLDRIKSAHGQGAMLNVFLAAPVSMATELGRVRMAKADMAWRVFDQVNERGGFFPALSIPLGG